MHFRPMLDPRPCWHCTSFGGLTYQGSAAACQHRGSYHVRAMPENGCAFWKREVGADDEPDQRPTPVTCAMSGGVRPDRLNPP